MNSIIKLTEYDLMSIAKTDGNYYMCIDSRKLYKDTADTRLIVPCIIVNTEMDRQYNINPLVGQYYYIWETNELWLFNGAWVVIVGSSKKYNGFYYSQGTMQGVDETTVIDNNGLLKDGSVVVRDINRVIKGRMYINQDIDEAGDTNSLVISSMLGGGITFLPNGAMDGSGALKLLSAGTYVGPTGDTEVLEYGEMIFYGDIYVVDNSGVKHKITSVDVWDAIEEIREIADDAIDIVESRVPKSRTINGKSLETDIELNATDVGADPKGSASSAVNSARQYTDKVAEDVGKSLDNRVPKSTKINNKELTTDIELTASDIGADPKGTSEFNVFKHDTDNTSHSDIRILITNLTNRLNSIADSDDNTLDQLSELVDYIKNNRDFIESVTTEKVSVSDIIDNLTTNATDKPLSAYQGVVLKSLIDELKRSAIQHYDNKLGHVDDDDRSKWNRVEDKVDKVSGKGLSTNDFSNSDKDKLDGIAENANNYVHPLSGVRSGTYRSVTVDSEGHVTGGSNPTTLAEYGIVDADYRGTASTEVANHNVSLEAHSDLRHLINELSDRLNALMNSDESTLDQMTELVQYIEDNQDLINSVTITKVNVEDIVDDLATNASDRPLSATQGVILKELIGILQAEVDALNLHPSNINNPHNVTKEQIGLSNVPNVTTNNQTPTYTESVELVTLESGEKLSTAFGKIKLAITTLINHITNRSNPHNVTVSQIGAVPTSRTINGKSLSDNVSINYLDVGADPAGMADNRAKTVQDNLDSHMRNEDVHVTKADKDKLDSISENANNYVHPNSGIKPGTYKSVTVDSEGHIISGSNPTTLNDYGITDAEVKGSAKSAVASHNSSTSAHSDIRELITILTNRLNSILNTDDNTIDQVSEMVQYIKDNKDLIDSITTGKVNTSDIVNDLTTNSSSKVLSASQGVVIKDLIDTLKAEVDAHEERIDNPHGVTKEQVGLGNVPNVTTNDQTPTYNETTVLSELISGEKLRVALSKIAKAVKDFISHKEDQDIHVSIGEKSEWDSKATKDIATEESDGLMSMDDKAKLNSIEDGANNYEHPTDPGSIHIPAGGSDGQILRWAGDGNAEWSNEKDTTYSDFVRSGTGAKSGLVPAPPISPGTDRYLREDGSWSLPPMGENPYKHPVSGVTPGTYNSVTVDKDGHVTNGTNPTTLAEYGIVDAEAKGTAESMLTIHNSAEDSHTDIRALITGLTSRLNALADSDDTTLDQMSEMVQYIKDNRELIESVTTGKVNVSDIVDDLTTGGSDKPLSAAQGIILKNMINDIQNNSTHANLKDNPHSVTKEQVGLGNVPNVTTNDQTPTYTTATTLTVLTSGEKLSVLLGKIAKAVSTLIDHIADTVSHVTQTEKNTWNAKADTSTATTSANGLMSSTDKTKLDSISANANAYTHPTGSGSKHIPSGGSSGQILRWSADGTAVWGADSNTTYGVATTSADGLMSKEDKAKLSSIETEVSSLKNSVSDGKTKVANAITAKGVSTATTATFDTMATNIGKISGYTPAVAITSFSASGYNVSPTVTLSWSLPSDANRSGIMVRYSTSSYPTSESSGSLVYDTNTYTGSSTTSCTFTAPYANTNYYLTILTYTYVNNRRYYTVGAKISFKSIAQFYYKYTTSGTFTVPTGVTQISVFMVGGGHSGKDAKYVSGGYTSYQYGGDGGNGGNYRIVTINTSGGSKFNYSIAAGGGGATTFGSYTTADGTAGALGGIGAKCATGMNGGPNNSYNASAGSNGVYAFNDQSWSTSYDNGTRYCAGGGGGGSRYYNKDYDDYTYSPAAGGVTGGGSGGNVANGSAASANTGSGGGGGGYYYYCSGSNATTTYYKGGAGGSGCIIVRIIK